jgi:hypothetical protein
MDAATPVATAGNRRHSARTKDEFLDAKEETAHEKGLGLKAGRRPKLKRSHFPRDGQFIKSR